MSYLRQELFRAWLGPAALLAWVLALATVKWYWDVPDMVLIAYGVLSVATFLGYWRDKSAARRGAWRTAESTLQALALLGGWPGALLAQRWLRHKTKKTSFQIVFWLAVLLHMVVVAGICWSWRNGWFPLSEWAAAGAGFNRLRLA